MKKAILALCSLALLGGACGICAQASTLDGPLTSRKAGGGVSVDSLSFEDAYEFGSTFKAPEASFSLDGQSVDASAYLLFPSGRSVSASEAKLSEAGQYRLIYRAYASGKALEKSFSFLVVRKLYAMDGDRSQLYFGNAPYMEKEEEKGIVASISPYESFTWNEPIDLSDYDSSKALLTLNLTPATIGVADATKILIKLTDRHDSNNVVTIQLKKCEDNGAEWAENNTYVDAYATGQLPTGLEDSQKTGTLINYKGTTYKYHKNNYYGARIPYSMAGAPHYVSSANPNYEESFVRDQSMSIYFDYESGVVYAGSSPKIVTDLKDATIQEGSPLWEAFTTGEAILSVSAEGYNAERCTMLISEVAGHSASELSINELKDEDAPSISIDFKGFDKDELPDGLVNKSYPLFPSSAKDYLDGECEVSEEVYLNYGFSSQVSIPVADHSFTPKVPGVYTLAYRAKDRSGNETLLTYSLKIQASADTLDVASSTPSSGPFYSGQSVKVPTLTYKNARGAVNEAISAKLVGKDVTYDVVDGEFTPLYAGDYEITYVYSDYLFAGTRKETIKVLAGEKPSLIGAPSLPEYLILGCEYELADLTGEDYSSGEPVASKVSIYAQEGSSAKKKIEGTTYTPSAAGDVTLTYEVAGAKGTDSLECHAKVVDCGYNVSGRLDIGSYFQGNASKYEAKNSEIEYFSDGTNDLNLSFVNSLQAFEFSLRFRAGSLPNFKVVTFTLTDSLDSSIAVDFTYRKADDGSLSFAVNNSASTAIAGSFEDAKSSLTFSYANSSCLASGASGNEKEVTKDKSGNAFAGFPSGSVYLSVKVSSMSGASSISFTNLSGQPLTKVKADLIEPKISASAERGERKFGDVLTLSPVYFGDVLDPNIKTSMKVSDPSGVTVKDDSGVALDGSDPSLTYHITLNQYGPYTITYSAEDHNGNKTTYSYVVRIVDDTAPKAVLLDHATKGKVGEKIAIAGIKVSEESSESVYVLASLRTPDGRQVSLGKINADGTLSPSASFTPSQKGTYKVSYMIYDDAGNSVFLSYEVEVSE